MISDEYTVVLLFESSDAYANMITQAFSTTGCPHILKHIPSITGCKDYLTNSVDEHSSEKYIRPRLILLSAENVDGDARDLLEFIKTHPLLKLIPVVIFCSVDCEQSVGADNLQHINSFVKRKNSMDEDREIITHLARYWLKWNNLPP